MSLLRIWMNLIEPAIYKYYVPPGLPVWSETLLETRSYDLVTHRGMTIRLGIVFPD